MDRLTEYDYEVHHEPATSNKIRIADGLSRMPKAYTQPAFAEDSKRMAMSAQPAEKSSSNHIEGVWDKHEKSEFYGLVATYLKLGDEGLDGGPSTSDFIRFISLMSFREPVWIFGNLLHRKIARKI